EVVVVECEGDLQRIVPRHETGVKSKRMERIPIVPILTGQAGHLVSIQQQVSAVIDAPLEVDAGAGGIESSETENGLKRQRVAAARGAARVVYDPGTGGRIRNPWPTAAAAAVIKIHSWVIGDTRAR